MLSCNILITSNKYLPGPSNEPGHAKTCLISYANNKDNQPAHPRSMISIFVVHCLGSTTSLVVIFEISRLQLASVTEQAGLNLTWSKIPEDVFV